MKLSNISVVFIIIVIPIILLLSYYISLQIDTMNIQTSYTSKQSSATKEAIEAFEINTVEWNESYSETADSKRRDVMASINTFTTNFANSLGIGGTSRENILAYVPAIACTLYDGYYIYSPTEIKSVIKDEKGIAVFMTEDLADEIGYGSYNEENDEGKLLYEAERNAQGTYTTNNGISKSFTLNPNDAKSTYSHILKPFSTYSARYKKGDTDITVNYTLDNYITIYGVVGDEGYVVKSGYLIDIDSVPENIGRETLTEKIWYEGIEEWKFQQGFTYVYAEDNTKVYFDGNTAFQVSSTGTRTDLDLTTGVKYKKIRSEGGTVIYQALNKGSIKKKNSEGEDEIIEIKQGFTYTDKQGTGENDRISILKYDYSAKNYYVEAKAFSNWVQNNLKNITIGNIQDVSNVSLYGASDQSIFKIDENNNPEREDSIFTSHKREIIKQSLISNLNQAITSYSRYSHNTEVEGEFYLPVLTEDDWNHILRNVSIITFVQNLPIGMKYYNNYTIATSTSNKEYVNPDEIYLSTKSYSDGYYHMPYCEKLNDNNLIGYKNIDYVVESYDIEEITNYYYKHSNIANQSCYYCLVQRSLYTEDKTDAKVEAYETALARERYVTHEFR